MVVTSNVRDLTLIASTNHRHAWGNPEAEKHNGRPSMKQPVMRSLGMVARNLRHSTPVGLGLLRGNRRGDFQF